MFERSLYAFQVIKDINMPGVRQSKNLSHELEEKMRAVRSKENVASGARGVNRSFVPSVPPMRNPCQTERLHPTLSTSSNYASTLDDIARPDRDVSGIELRVSMEISNQKCEFLSQFTPKTTLQETQEKHSRHLKEIQRGLERRRQLTRGTLALLAVILTSIIVGFSVVLCQKTKEISIIEDKLLALRNDTNRNAKSLGNVTSAFEEVQSKTEDIKDNIRTLNNTLVELEIDHHIGYRYLNKLPRKLSYLQGK